jgi:hypothetical protein
VSLTIWILVAVVAILALASAYVVGFAAGEADTERRWHDAVTRKSRREAARG